MNINCHRMDANGAIKVGDFGFSEDISTSSYYRQKKSDTDVKLPVRWMAPESITVGIFTEKSDIVSAVNTLSIWSKIDALWYSIRTVVLYFNTVCSGHMESHVGRCSLVDRSPTVESVQ